MELMGVLKVAKQLSFGLKSSVRMEMALLLFYSDKPLYFSEIREYIQKRYPEKRYTSSAISYHLGVLRKNEFLVRENKPDISTGKKRYSQYRLSEKGKKRIGQLIKEIERFKKT